MAIEQSIPTDAPTSSNNSGEHSVAVDNQHTPIDPSNTVPSEQALQTLTNNHASQVQQQHTAMRIDALRKWRVRPQRLSHAGQLVELVADNARRAQREVGGFAAAWQKCADATIVNQTRIASFRGGVATIVTHNASLRWVIDRDLRSGLLSRLRSECTSAITAVRVRSGAVNAPR